MIRARLGPQIYQGACEAALSALKAHALFRGRHLGIDASVIEANASLCILVHRNTEEAYWDDAKALAAQQGVDREDEAALQIVFIRSGRDAKRAMRTGRTPMIRKPRWGAPRGEPAPSLSVLLRQRFTRLMPRSITFLMELVNNQLKGV